MEEKVLWYGREGRIINTLLSGGLGRIHEVEFTDVEERETKMIHENFLEFVKDVSFWED